MMCGIYGIVSLNHDSIPGAALLSRMGAAVEHRGPDDEGKYLGRGVALGMRRLSIIDLSGGHQPISNETETVWVVCNGEIYNFLELRELLLARGHVFQSKSDTEVLVHLYEDEGLDFVKHLRGMFSIALWDTVRERLVLARDRVGKKPLYVWRSPNTLIFASEIKSILQAEEVPRRMNLAALPEYLSLGYVPAPNTIFEGIEKLLPGHLLVYENGSITDQEYWDPQFNRIESHSEGEWIELIREKFLESVRIRLVSDVPLGAFLSGGIDSSAVVAAMARLTDRPVKTYSIGFEGDDEFYNELPYARIIAKAYATDHHEIIVRPDVSDLLPKLIWHMDEPIADSAMVTTYLVSRLARESVTVILSGVGGDEIFGGYRRYLSDNLQRHYQHLPGFIRNIWLPKALNRLPQDRHSGWRNNVRYAAAFVNTAGWDRVTRYSRHVGVFSPEAAAEILGSATAAQHPHHQVPSSETLRHYFGRCSDCDGLNQLIYVDLKTSLPDDLLLLTDKMSMAASIECRAPFIDSELIELTGRMPSNLKVHGLTLKYLLKKAVQPWLPAEILRRKKRGFGAPVGSWLRKDLRFLVQETLSPDQVRKRGIFDPAAVQSIITAHDSQRRDHTDHLLSLINLELWSRIFLDHSDWRTVHTAPEPAFERR
jgi:asparagine synthase (glutamine-hydrolysing)